MATAQERCVAELRSLGLSALEATIYLHLLRQPGSTGYRVAHALGKPAANVYAALESLRTKGAVVLEQGGGRAWRALPAASLERVLTERFRARTKRLAGALEAWQESPDEGGAWALEEPAQVYAQAQAMLARARTVAIADVFPGPLTRLVSSFEKAAARGVPVAVQAYAPASLKGVEVVVSARGRSVLERWPAEWLQLVVDGSEALVALLSSEGERVVHSTWTTSPHLAWTAHSALSGDLLATRLVAALEAGSSVKSLRALARRLQSRFRAPDAEGYRRLVGATRAESAAREPAAASRSSRSRRRVPGGAS